MEIKHVFWHAVSQAGITDASRCKSCGRSRSAKSSSASKTNCRSCEGEKGSRLAPVFTFDENLAMSAVRDPGMPGTPWSRGLKPLQRMLSLERHTLKTKINSVDAPAGLLRDECFVYQHFEDLNLSNMEIALLDASLLEFSNLKELTLDKNKLRVLENLPRNLTILNANCNKIQAVIDVADINQSADKLDLSGQSSF